MKPETKKLTHTPCNLWTCPACGLLDGMEQPAFLAHIKEVHGITVLKGKRSMNMHIDGSDFFTSVYEWEVGGMKFGQTVCCTRTGASRAMWDSP